MRWWWGGCCYLLSRQGGDTGSQRVHQSLILGEDNSEMNVAEPHASCPPPPAGHTQAHPLSHSRVHPTVSHTHPHSRPHCLKHTHILHPHQGSGTPRTSPQVCLHVTDGGAQTLPTGQWSGGPFLKAPSTPEELVRCKRTSPTSRRYLSEESHFPIWMNRPVKIQVVTLTRASTHTHGELLRESCVHLWFPAQKPQAYPPGSRLNLTPR